LANGQVNLVAVPRPSWKPFFERVVATRTQAENQRETSLELSVECGSWRLLDDWSLDLDDASYGTG